MKRERTPPTVSRDVLLFLDRELKQPITNILALSQTLAAGRVNRASVREYARLTGFEAARLNRLLDKVEVLLRLEPEDVAPSEARPEHATKRVSVAAGRHKTHRTMNSGSRRASPGTTR